MLKPFAALSLIILLAACEAPQQRLSAAEDVRSFLVAAREGDEATFDRHVDRPALKANLRGEIDEVLAGQPIPARMRDQLLDQLVDGLGPEMFQAATQGAGPLAGRTPSAAEIAAVLKPLGPTRVCLPPQPGADQCAATFEKKGETWKLVAVDAGSLRVGPGLPAGTEFLERFPSAAER